MVLGSSVTNSTTRGYLYGAVTFFYMLLQLKRKRIRSRIAFMLITVASTTPPAVWMRHACDGCFKHGRMFHQGALHLRKVSDAVAGAFDDVVRPANIPAITVLIFPRNISRMVYAAMPDWKR